MSDTTNEGEPFDAEEAMRRFASLNRRNEEAMQTLGGRGAMPNPFGITAQRVEVLIDFLLGDWPTTEARLAFEVAWQEHLHEILTDGLNKTVGQSLIVPKQNGGGPNGLHLP